MQSSTRSYCSCCKLVKYSSKIFIKNPQRKDCQQPDSTIADSPLRAIGLDKNLCHYTKQSSYIWPVECNDPPKYTVWNPKISG